MEVKKRKYYFKKIKPFINRQLIIVITGDEYTSDQQGVEVINIREFLMGVN